MGRLLLLLGTITVAGCGGTPYRDAPMATPGDSDRLSAAESALTDGRDAEARRLFEGLTSAAYPASVRGRASLGLGRIALRAGDIDTAILRLNDSRTLLRRSALWPTAELLYGDARIRAGHLQTGIEALENSYEYLISPEDRSRAAYLICKVHEVGATDPPQRYIAAAHGVKFPEYDKIFDVYVVESKPIVRVEPTPVPRVDRIPAPAKNLTIVPVEHKRTWPGSHPYLTAARRATTWRLHRHCRADFEPDRFCR